MSGEAGNLYIQLSMSKRYDFAVIHAAECMGLFFKISSRTAPVIDSWRFAHKEKRLTVKMGCRKVETRTSYSPDEVR
jgi:hypothetical protein